MKRIFFFLLFIASLSLNAQEIIYKCGQNSGTNFNGWFIAPYNAFQAINYNEQSVSFLVEYGGKYSVTLTKKIEKIAKYDEFDVLFNFTVKNNSTIENVTYYTSIDGKKWTALNESKNNTAVKVKNPDRNICYVKAVAQTQFYDNGIIACNFVKIGTSVNPNTQLSLLPETLDFPDESFFIFNLAHSVNIETAIDLPYEVTVFSLTGQIVYKNIHEGSERIELPNEMSGVFVITVTQNNALQATKKIAL